MTQDSSVEVAADTTIADIISQLQAQEELQTCKQWIDEFRASEPNAKTLYFSLVAGDVEADEKWFTLKPSEVVYVDDRRKQHASKERPELRLMRKPSTEVLATPGRYLLEYSLDTKEYKGRPYYPLQLHPIKTVERAKPLR
jgi:hypothetical protein